MRTYSPKDIADFIVAHYPRSQEWEGRHIINWVAWCIERGFCLLAGDGDTLKGLLLVRPVFDPQNMVNKLDFDPEGDTYFIDMAIALAPKRETLQGLGLALIKRFGQRDKLAFQKQGMGPVYVVDAHAHRRKLLRTLTKT